MINKPVSNYAFLSILSVFVLTDSVLVNWDLPVHAQNQSSVDFLTYQNPTEGYSIKYPSDWQVTGNGISDAAIRFSPSDVSKLSLIIITMEPVPYLDTGTMTVKNTTLQELRQEILSHKIPFRQNNVTVGENSGIKNEYFDGKIYSFEIFIIGNGKLYGLVYCDESLNVPKTLPVVNKMVESFQLIQ